MQYIYLMKLMATIMTGWMLAVATIVPSYAHTSGATTVHEITQETAPNATLDIQKDPTGGFNVQVVTTNFVWRPEMASMQHVPGEGHAHVYLDGRKIMRIYNEWFHLNTFQFSTRSGEQLLSIEFVGNDHAPYTIQGLPVGAEQIVDVPSDEIQPSSRDNKTLLFGLIFLVVIGVGGLLFRLRRGK
jgi:hypothetical protein